jgi:hypothetical protein
MNLRPVGRVWRLSIFVGFCSLVFGLGGLAWGAQGQVGLGYAPDGPKPICHQSENLPRMDSTDSRFGT